MKTILATAILLLSAHSNYGLPHSADSLTANLSVKAHKAHSQIIIDGILNEEEWKNQPIDNFTQRDPEEGKPSSERTYVWVAYDSENIYLAAKLFDSQPDSIDAALSRKDKNFLSDRFGFYIDPYSDKKTGYFFVVNAGGSVMDGVLFDDGGDDESWDGVWESKAIIDADGWSVEMRIPFSQLRFNESKTMTWGVNFVREIKRKNELSFFVMVPKKESGFVSKFARLENLEGIVSKQRVEFLPYFVQKAQYLIHDANDPFYKGNQYKTSLGADVKIGIGSNRTLDATINPDFGQVEVDPAVVNLTAFETFYQEKRPFFIEGASIARFGSGGSNNNWSFNWSSPNLFYSRRIGRTPRGYVDSDGAVDYPGETRILGAVKISGKIDENWSVMALTAFTERTFAKVIEKDLSYEKEIEPLTNFNLFRAQRLFDKGRSAIGFIGTGLWRDLRESDLNLINGQRALTGGVDGWLTLDKEDTYVLTGYLVGSHIAGSKDYLIRVQRAPHHYFQRPDASYSKLDSNAVTMDGLMGRIALNKQKGNFFINSAFGFVTPGFETNDMGFQSRSNVLNAHLVTGYRWYEPDGLFRRKAAYLTHFQSFNFEGINESKGIFFFAGGQLMNFWDVDIKGNYGAQTYNSKLTRGGPLAVSPESYSIGFDFRTDEREKIIFEFDSYTSNSKVGDNYLGISTEITWKPLTQLLLSFTPSYNININKVQWVTKVPDDKAVLTYGTRYVFAELNQKSISGDIRIDWTFTPKASLQLFLQPLLSSGVYNNFKELSRPSKLEYNLYGNSVTFDPAKNEYSIDPQNNGNSFKFSNPDFNFKSLRANLVFRWEFLPGSTFYLVWTHDKTNLEDPSTFLPKRDFKNLFQSESNNVLLLKFSYWLST